MPLNWRNLSTKGLDAKMPPEAVRRMWGSGPIMRASGQPYRTGWDLQRAVDEGMLRSIWTFKSIDAIAKAIALLPIEFPKGSYGAEEVLPANTLQLDRRLNFMANPYEYAIGFKYRLVSQILLSRKGVFIEVERGKGGEIEWMWLLNPDKTSPIPDEKTFVSGYEIANNGGSPVTLPADRVLWLRVPHPTDPYLSLTPLDAAGLSIDLDYYARLYNRNFMANDGRPGGILSMKGPVPETDIEIMRTRFQNPKPGEITVVESDGMSFADLSTTPRDAAYANLAKMVKDEVLFAFGVSESVLASSRGVTYDNAEAEENTFWRVTCKPLIKFIDMALSSLTPGGNDDDLWVRHDTSGVIALQRPVRENENRVMERFREGGATLNDVLDVLKQPRIDRPGANTYFIPAGKIGIAATPEEQAEVEKLMAIGGGAAGQPAPAAQGAPGGAPSPFGLPPGPTRIGQLLAARQQALGSGGAQTVRSPEAIDTRLARDAADTAARRDALSVKSEGEPTPGHWCVMLPVVVTDARHIWRASPVPATISDPHITVGLFDARSEGEAMSIIQEWAARVGPIEVTIGPDSWVWPDSGDGAPFVVGVHSDSLMAANKLLGDIVTSRGAAMTGKGVDNYRPHFTVTYLTDPAQENLSLVDPVFVKATIRKAILSAPGKGGAKIDIPLEG